MQCFQHESPAGLQRAGPAYLARNGSRLTVVLTSVAEQHEGGAEEGSQKGIQEETEGEAAWVDYGEGGGGDWDEGIGENDIDKDDEDEDGIKRVVDGMGDGPEAAEDEEEEAVPDPVQVPFYPRCLCPLNAPAQWAACVRTVYFGTLFRCLLEEGRSNHTLWF